MKKVSSSFQSARSVRKFYIILSVLLGVVGFFRCCLFVQGENWVDFPGQWRICAYTLSGYDPYACVGVTPAPIEYIGVIPLGWGTSPWGCLLGNLFYPGFLAFETAKAYFILIHFCFLFFTTWYLHSHIKTKMNSFSFYALLISLSSLNFFAAFFNGNAGGLICSLLLVSCLSYRDYPVFTGVLLGFAMTKPQSTMLVCYALLLQKRWKPVAIAAMVDAGAFAMVSFLTKTPVITLACEFLSSNTGNGHQFSGIFTLLFPNESRAAMLCSMFTGIVFVTIFHRIWPKDTFSAFRLYPALVASTFWSYTWNNDNYMLVLPALICVWIMLQTSEFLKALFWSLASLYCGFTHISMRAINLALKILYLVLPGEYNPSWLSKTIYELGLIVLSILLIIYLRNYAGDDDVKIGQRNRSFIDSIKRRYSQMCENKSS